MKLFDTRKICVLMVALASILGAVHSARADSAWDGDKVVFAAQLDLDGDGRKENIRLQNLKKKSGDQWITTDVFRLDVNGQHLFDSTGDYDVQGFGLADIDRSDRFKEIFVYGYGPADYASYNIYRWEKGRLHRVGKVIYPTFLGDGRVKCYASPGNFSSTYLHYRLNAQGKLALVPQRLYPLHIYRTEQKHGEKWVEAAAPLYLRSKPVKGKTSATFYRGTRFYLLYTDMNGWYLVRSVQGTTGWLDEPQIYRGVKYLVFAG